MRACQWATRAGSGGDAGVQAGGEHPGNRFRGVVVAGGEGAAGCRGGGEVGGEFVQLVREGKAPHPREPLVRRARRPEVRVRQVAQALPVFQQPFRRLLTINERQPPHLHFERLVLHPAPFPSVDLPRKGTKAQRKYRGLHPGDTENTMHFIQ